MNTPHGTPTRARILSRRRAQQLLGLGPGTLFLAACTGAAPQAGAPASPTIAPVSKPPATPASSGQAQPTALTVSTPASSATAAVARKSGGILRALQAGDLSSIDGHYYTTGSGLSVWIIYDTLTVYDDNLKPQPALAESWEQSPDGTSITLALRKGVQFHTGRELTSDDVIYNLNRILDFKLTAGIITGFVPPETTCLTADPQYQGLELPNPAAFWMLQPNSMRAPMDDKRVRQALNYAINRQRMVDTVLLGLSKPQDSRGQPARPPANRRRMRW